MVHNTAVVMIKRVTSLKYVHQLPVTAPYYRLFRPSGMIEQNTGLMAELITVKI